MATGRDRARADGPTAGPIVAVKLGADGALACRAGGPIVRVPAMPIEPVDTTGAGDSFDAGFLRAWLDGGDLARALSSARSAAALSTRRVGGVDGQPTLAEARRCPRPVGSPMSRSGRRRTPRAAAVRRGQPVDRPAVRGRSARRRRDPPAAIGRRGAGRQGAQRGPGGGGAGRLGRRRPGSSPAGRATGSWSALQSSASTPGWRCSQRRDADLHLGPRPIERRADRDLRARRRDRVQPPGTRSRRSSAPSWSRRRRRHRALR